MKKCCGPLNVKTQKFRKVVWVALVLNFTMFIYEFGSSFLADSQSLKADSLDFFGDSANYAILMAAIGVSYGRTRWPDLIVAGFMSCLCISASLKVLKLARVELKAELKNGP